LHRPSSESQIPRLEHSEVCVYCWAPVADGVNFQIGVQPTRIEKLADGRLSVSFNNGSTEVYDTVLAAIGRRADTAVLNCEGAGVNILPRNGKIDAPFEQTNVPHIYAIGDVLEGRMELTPVAIQAGQYLSRRLFGNSTELMDYETISTTVFTPIEYGTVGITEEVAEERLGNNLEAYVSNFSVLEWSLKGFTRGREDTKMDDGPDDEEEHEPEKAFTKVLVDKRTGNVVGMHILGPHAGEVIQGYGVAVKRGITFDDLSRTVGIHPTVAEQFTTMTVTKSSGESADAGGC